MDEHTKKIVAPVIITIIFVFYYIGFAGACLLIHGIPAIIKLLFGIIPLAFAGVMVYVLLTRINEIRSGEEDDLSKY